MLNLSKIVEKISHPKSPNSDNPSGGKNIRYIAITVGKGATNIKGCLRPSLDMNRSEIDPMTGSEIASKMIAIKTAKPVREPDSPRT